MTEKNDFIYLYNKLIGNTNDPAQLNTLNRIKKHKFYFLTVPLFDKNQDTSTQYSSNVSLISKNCPHCEKKIYDYDNKHYIICGYTEKGYDWIGCGKDWCFKCGKKLCKSWDKNSLFDTINRFHNGKCCKVYAQRHNSNYYNDFCQCLNKYVNRIDKYTMFNI